VGGCAVEPSCEHHFEAMTVFVGEFLKGYE